MELPGSNRWPPARKVSTTLIVWRRMPYLAPGRPARLVPGAYSFGFTSGFTSSERRWAARPMTTRLEVRRLSTPRRKGAGRSEGRGRLGSRHHSASSYTRLRLLRLARARWLRCGGSHRRAGGSRPAAATGASAGSLSPCLLTRDFLLTRICGGYCSDPRQSRGERMSEADISTTATR